MLKTALNGKGLKGNSLFDLFGMPTTASAISESGCFIVYTINEVRKINQKICSFIANKISILEKKSMDEIKGFDQKNLLKQQEFIIKKQLITIKKRMMILLN